MFLYANFTYHCLANQVRNEMAEDFLSLLMEWEKLCSYFSLIQSNIPHQYDDFFKEAEDDDGNDTDSDENESDNEDNEVFEVLRVLAICYGDPKSGEKKIEKKGLHFKVCSPYIFVFK